METTKKNKCYSTGAKKFENMLNQCNLSYNKFMELRKFYDNTLMQSERAELDNILREYPSEESSTETNEKTNKERRKTVKQIQNHVFRKQSDGTVLVTYPDKHQVFLSRKGADRLYTALFATSKADSLILKAIKDLGYNKDKIHLLGKEEMENLYYSLHSIILRNKLFVLDAGSYVKSNKLEVSLSGSASTVTLNYCRHFHSRWLKINQRVSLKYLDKYFNDNKKANLYLVGMNGITKYSEQVNKESDAATYIDNKVKELLKNSDEKQKAKVSKLYYDDSLDVCMDANGNVLLLKAVGLDII